MAYITLHTYIHTYIHTHSLLDMHTCTAPNTGRVALQTCLHTPHYDTYTHCNTYKHCMHACMHYMQTLHTHMHTSHYNKNTHTSIITTNTHTCIAFHDIHTYMHTRSSTHNMQYAYRCTRAMHEHMYDTQRYIHA